MCSKTLIHVRFTRSTIILPNAWSSDLQCNVNVKMVLHTAYLSCKRNKRMLDEIIPCIIIMGSMMWESSLNISRYGWMDGLMDVRWMDESNMEPVSFTSLLRAVPCNFDLPVRVSTLGMHCVDGPKPHI